MGNPDYPGLTSAGWGLPNWIDVLTTHAPANTLTYNLANGASVCDISLDEGHDPQRVPDFIAQAQTFVEQLATGMSKQSNSVSKDYKGSPQPT